MTNDPRSTYLQAAVETGGSDRLLVMLMNRLQLDVGRAVEAQEAADHQAAHHHLIHAQDIVMELRSSLDLEVWPAGAPLGALYDWLTMQLVQANIKRDVTITRACVPLVDQLTDTWREAAMAAAGISA